MAAAAILGMSAVTALAAPADDQVAQAPVAQNAPAAEPATIGQASPTEDKTPAADKTGATATAEKPVATAVRPERTAHRAVTRAAAPARTTRLVRREAYRIAESIPYERPVRGGCWAWCGQTLFIGIAY
jgi:hypothetical protein